jgi:tetratricopeptide (TPR) repeat protein
MDDKERELSQEDLEKARKTKAQLRGITIFFLIWAVPILIGTWLVLRVNRSIAKDKAWAEAELQKSSPDPRAWGALGAIDLNEGRIEEALPRLKKASEIEKASGQDVKAHLIYVEALLEARKKALPEWNEAEAVGVLKQMLDYADKLPKGRSAAAWHGAGKLYQHLEKPKEALACLKKASELQPDDWVDEGGPAPYKYRGIASTYAKDYAAAQMN